MTSTRAKRPPVGPLKRASMARQTSDLPDPGMPHMSTSGMVLGGTTCAHATLIARPTAGYYL